jgi:LacI family transcriptional regulator
MLDRKRGYEDLLRDQGLYNPFLVKEINYSTLANDMSIAIESLLSNGNRVDGIFYATNTLSMLGIKQLLNFKLQIPRNISVVCFDKNDAFDFIHTTIPYIQQPIMEMGVKAVGLLIDQIKQKSKGVATFELQTELKNRT